MRLRFALRFSIPAPANRIKASTKGRREESIGPTEEVGSVREGGAPPSVLLSCGMAYRVWTRWRLAPARQPSGRIEGDLDRRGLGGPKPPLDLLGGGLLPQDVGVDRQHRPGAGASDV